MSWPMRNGPPSQYTCTKRVRTVFHGGPILTEHLYVGPANVTAVTATTAVTYFTGLAPTPPVTETAGMTAPVSGTFSDLKMYDRKMFLEKNRHPNMALLCSGYIHLYG